MPPKHLRGHVYPPPIKPEDEMEDIRKLARRANHARQLSSRCETLDTHLYHQQAVKLSGRLKYLTHKNKKESTRLDDNWASQRP